MFLNSPLTGPEPWIGQILPASEPSDIVSAISRRQREIQVNHLTFLEQFPVSHMAPVST